MYSISLLINMYLIQKIFTCHYNFFVSSTQSSLSINWNCCSIMFWYKDNGLSVRASGFYYSLSHLMTVVNERNFVVTIFWCHSHSLFFLGFYVTHTLTAGWFVGNILKFIYNFYTFLTDCQVISMNCLKCCCTNTLF